MMTIISICTLYLTDLFVSEGLERELKGLHNKKGSQLTVYGQWVPYLLNKIDNAHANGLFTKKPIGPMGKRDIALCIWTVLHLTSSNISGDWLYNCWGTQPTVEK